MLFWIFVILLIGSIILFFVDDYRSVLTKLSSVMALVSFIIVAIMLVCIIAEHTGVDGYVARMNAKREALAWQLENNIYDNDNDIGKYELMTEIREWNENIANAREAQDNFWIGIFYADIYDQFELIPLE